VCRLLNELSKKSDIFVKITTFPTVNMIAVHSSSSLSSKQVYDVQIHNPVLQNENHRRKLFHVEEAVKTSRGAVKISANCIQRTILAN
jgi:hypothetical protein